MKKTGFERYASFIKNYIYRKGWTDLREVQEDACREILDTDHHVLVASGTASGKTEAVFFPMLTLLDQESVKSVGIMYIGPLKALINDQFQRLQELLEEKEIPVWPWHGDVSQSIKKRAMDNCRGILQITPESLESLLIRHPEMVKILFGDLRFVVIDEIHELMGQDRGSQVLCLLERLHRMSGCNPRRIGLSATLYDYQPAMQYLGAGTEREVSIVGAGNGKRKLALFLENFDISSEDGQKEAREEDFYQFLYRLCQQKKCLIFTNSRNQAEEVIAHLKKTAQKEHTPDIYYVHHGSISKSLREETEQVLKNSEGPVVAAATVTLELGIDIGDLDLIIQIGAPFTCSSFVQRLGRSGRRTGKSQMIFLSQEEEQEIVSLEEMPWEFLRSIAVIQLYLEEKWVESFIEKRKPFSLLAHQTLSILLTYGELSPPQLAEKVLTLPPFYKKITLDDYRKLLRYMLEKEYLQRMENGGLILGLKGEKITEYYSFYGVFPEEELYHVISVKGEIGTLSRCPAEGGTFSLAGQSWKVQLVDRKYRKVFVQAFSEGKSASWIGNGGMIHGKIMKQVKKVLKEDIMYSYLQPNAQKLLQKARAFMREKGYLEEGITVENDGTFQVCPWCGTKELRTMEILLNGGLKEELQIHSVWTDDCFLSITSGLSLENFRKKCKEISVRPAEPDLILGKQKPIPTDKYDYMVPEELRRVAYVCDQLDVPGAVECFKNL